MRKRAAAIIGMLVASAAVRAEADPLPGFSLATQTAHLAVYTRAGEKTDADGAEKQLQRVAGALGISEPQPAAYYHYDEAGDLMAVNGVYAGGVTYPDRSQVHATKGTRDHELVHLLAYRLGDPGPFFQEGLAVVLGDHGRYLGRSVDNLAKPLARRSNLTALIAAFDRTDPRDGYAVAGSFVNWMVKRYGMPRVAEFFRACHKQQAPVVFAAVFGISLEEAGGEWTRQL